MSNLPSIIASRLAPGLAPQPPPPTTLFSVDYTDAGTFPDGGMAAATFAAIPSVAQAAITFSDATATTTNTVQTAGGASPAWSNTGGVINTYGANVVRFGSQSDANHRGKYLEGASTNVLADCRPSAYSPGQDGITCNVTGATNANPIVVAHDGPDDVQTGDLVTITGVGGNTAANVTLAPVTRVDATHFSINGVAGNGAYTSGGTVVVKSKTTTGQADTAGGTTFIRFQIATTGQTTPVQANYGTAGQVCCQWQLMKAGSGGANYQMFTGTNTNPAQGGAAPATFQAVFESNTSNGLNVFHIMVDGADRTIYGGLAAGPRDVVLGWSQCEPLPAPSSLMYATGSSVSRAAGISPATWGANAIQAGGRIDWEYSWCPMWSWAMYLLLGVTRIYLRRKDANNFIAIDVPSGSVIVMAGGVSWVTGAISPWNGGDRIDLSIHAGGGSFNSFARYRVMPNGSSSWSAAYSLGTSLTPQPAFAAGTYYEGGDGTTTTLFGVVCYEGAFADGF